MKKERPDSKSEFETDPRFPSGKWTGFWLQSCYSGRQWMSLGLTFTNGAVVGEGSDRVGNFTINGKYNLKTGECSLVKAYQGAHSVIYKGRNDGDGLWIWGLWNMRTDRGGFHMWPADREDPTIPKLREQKELPREQPRVSLAPAEVEAA